MLLDLTLDRPLVIIDTETTGVDTDMDRIVQIGALRFDPDGTMREFNWYVNPGVPIPPEATAIHGISDADVASRSKFRAVWPELASLLAGADVCAYNAPFDLGMLEAECKRAGVAWVRPERVLDPLVIFRADVPHTLEGALNFYLGASHPDAHDALADCKATAVVLSQMARRLQDDCAVEHLAAASVPSKDDRYADNERKFYWRFGLPTFCFGKHKGKSLAEVARSDRSYLDWMLRQEYGAEVKSLVARALRGESLKRAAA